MAQKNACVSRQPDIHPSDLTRPRRLKCSSYLADIWLIVFQWFVLSKSAANGRIDQF